MTRRKKVRGKPGPKPGFMPAVNLRRAEERAAGPGLLGVLGVTLPKPPSKREVREAEEQAYIAAVRKDPIRGSKDLRTMEHAQMKLYAKGLSIPQFNIDDLPVERLRQNCLMKVATIVEALTE